MAINYHSVEDVQQAQSVLLEKFPEQYHEVLRGLTLQELFYAYKLGVSKPRDRAKLTPTEIFRSTLRSKLFRWLKGQDKHGIPSAAWEKIGRSWEYEFYEFSGVAETLIEEIDAA